MANRRTLLVRSLLALALALWTGVLVAYAQSAPQATRRIPAGPRRTVDTSPPPLPALQTPPPGMGIAAPRALPPLPSYASWLRTRRIKSASGGTICVTYAGNNSCAPGGSTQIVPTGGSVAWQPQNLLDTTANNYQDYVLTPSQATVDTSAGSPQKVGGTYTGPNGASHAATLSLPGVYVFASLNISRNQWDALYYELVGSKTDMRTYADAALSTESQTFTAGSSIYISTTGLTPTDSYVIAVENTSTSGYCVFTFPPSTQGPASRCNTSTVALAGANAPGGVFNATWNTSSTLRAGTYAVYLYDQTSGTRLEQVQIAIKGSSETSNLTFNVNYVPSNYSVTNASRVAFNGNTPYTDANATSLQVTSVGSGFAANQNYKLLYTDPNGTIFNTLGLNTGGGSFSAGPSNLTGSQSPEYFGPNVYTVSVADAPVGNNASNVFASRTIQLLGYTAGVTFSDGSIATNTQGGPPPATTKGIIYSNTSNTNFGAGNGDAIYEFQTVSGGTSSKFPLMAWADGSTVACSPVVLSGQATCYQETVQDSNFKTWTVQLACAGAGCGGVNNAARQYTVFSFPNTAGYGLPPNATLSVPNITFTQATGNACTSGGCLLSTSIYPLHGGGFSANGNNSTIADTLSILNNGVTYALVGSIANWGTVAGGTYDSTGTPLVQGSSQANGYQPRFAHLFYDAGSPQATAVAGIKQELEVDLTNTAGAPVWEVALTLPSTINTASVVLDGTKTSLWSVVACQSPAPVTNSVCLKRSSALAVGAGTDQIFLQTNPPTGSFANTSVGILATSNSGGFNSTSTNWSATSTGTTYAVAAGAPASVGSLDLQSYSLNAALMTGAATPATIGQASSGTRSQVVGWQLANTPAASDANPDPLDAIVISVDPQSTTNVPFTTALTASSWTVSPANWSLQGVYQPGGAGTEIYYLFGLCSSQNAPADFPTATATWGLGYASSCPNESTDSLLAGATFVAQATVNVGVGTGSVTGKMYAHGANGNGWSQGVPWTLTVTNTDAATAGFTSVNGTPVSTGSQPTVGGDPSLAAGSTYVYTFKNTGNTNITALNVLIPGPDISGASDQESSTQAYFNVTDSFATIKGALAYSGSGGALTQCTGGSLTNPSITSAGPPVVTGNGTLALSGCSIPPGYSVAITFHAKTPYTANSTYKFSSSFTGSGAGNAAAENWFSDQQLLITTGATMTIKTAPTIGSSGSNATPSWSCAYSLGGSGTPNLSSYLDFGTVAAGATETCTDAIMVSLATNVGGSVGWTLYVSADANPSNVVQVEVDSAHSGSGNSVAYSNTAAYVPVTTSTTGVTLASRASGTAATRIPYDIVTNWRVTPTDALPHTQYLTFTFIAN